MSDSRANGKLIYQLTSASALKDTDLFVISSSDNLTRSITLSQLKEAITSAFFSNDEIISMIDELKLQHKDLSDEIADVDNNISEFRNEFNNQLNIIRNDHTTGMNTLRSEFNNALDDTKEEFNDKITQVNNSISNLSKSTNTKFTEVDTRITNLNDTLSKRIQDLDTELTAHINGLISYGTEIPTTLATGKVYLQYF